MSLQKQIDHLFADKEQRMIEMRRWLHMHPEESLKEYNTAAFIEEKLRETGYTTRRVGETGVYTELKGKLPGPVTVIRADIDALRVQDLKTVDYRSRHDGLSHCCGHDMHTASLLGTAMALKELHQSLRGEIRLFFQQAEEVGAGAGQFIGAGLLEGAERIVGLHADSSLKVGQVVIKPGPNNASCDSFTMRVRGKAAHVSTPHLGADALYAASLIVTAIQGLTTRLTNPVEPMIIGVGKFTSGSSYNAIADFARLEGTTRYMDEGTRARMNRRIADLAEAIATQYNASVETTFADYSPALFNDPRVCGELQALCSDTGLDILTDHPLRLGADDFAEFLNLVPGAYIYIGTQGGESTAAPHHNGLFDIDERSMMIGSRLLCKYALSRHLDENATI